MEVAPVARVAKACCGWIKSHGSPSPTYKFHLKKTFLMMFVVVSLSFLGNEMPTSFS